MESFRPLSGGQWNQFKLGTSRAISTNFNTTIGHRIAALSASSEASSLKPRRQRKPHSLKSRATKLLQKFPLKVACTAGALSLTGDTIAQFIEREKGKQSIRGQDDLDDSQKSSEMSRFSIWNHDLFRATRMGSYGFLLYAPGTKVWYELLDRLLVGKTASNIALKVMANQLILGPTILTVVFTWNFFWMGKMKELPAKFKKDMVPSILNSFKFWLPATCLNFWVVPLQTRVAFMSMCGVFWNFYLSSNIGN